MGLKYFNLNYIGIGFWTGNNSMKSSWLQFKCANISIKLYMNNAAGIHSAIYTTKTTSYETSGMILNGNKYLPYPI